MQQVVQESAREECNRKWRENTARIFLVVTARSAVCWRTLDKIELLALSSDWLCGNLILNTHTKKVLKLNLDTGTQEIRYLKAPYLVTSYCVVLLHLVKHIFDHIGQNHLTNSKA